MTQHTDTAHARAPIAVSGWDRHTVRKSLQKALQQPAASRRTGSPSGRGGEAIPRVLRENAKRCDGMRLERVELIGLEPTTC
jgi:hypothetical protein